MKWNKFPLPVLIFSCLYIGVGTLGFVFHFRESLASPRDGVWIELTECIAIVCGVFMLRGRNWARWLALAWMAFHVVLSAFDRFRGLAVQLVPGCDRLVSFSSRGHAVFSRGSKRTNLDAKRLALC